MLLYKLTDQYGKTYGGTKWGENVTHTATGCIDQPLCSNAWIHAYEHPLIAVLMNPLHGKFNPARLWEAEGIVGLRDKQTKCGCRSLTTIRNIRKPTITIIQAVRVAILCAKEKEKDKSWNKWAKKWLDGTNVLTANAWKASNNGNILNSARSAARAAAYADTEEWTSRMYSADAAATVGASPLVDIDLIAIASEVVGEQ